MDTINDTINDTIKGLSALEMAEAVSKMGGDFTIAFYPFSRKKQRQGVSELRVMEKCSCRKPLPKDKFDIDGKHFFLFSDSKGSPKSCYRVLIRFMAFSNDGYKLRRVLWYE